MTDNPRNASAAVIGAGDFIGAAIARRYAAGGYAVFAGRRNGDKLAPLVAEIEAAGGRCSGHTLDARKEEAVTAFLAEADCAAPLEICIFNIGANVGNYTCKYVSVDVTTYSFDNLLSA